MSCFVSEEDDVVEGVGVAVCLVSVAESAFVACWARCGIDDSVFRKVKLFPRKSSAFFTISDAFR